MKPTIRARFRTNILISSHNKMNTLSREIRDELDFLIRNAAKHGLDSVKLTLPRAREFRRRLSETLPKHKQTTINEPNWTK